MRARQVSTPLATNVEYCRHMRPTQIKKGYKDLQRILGKFFIPENIPADSAMDFLASPR
jgi:hypothetical protein